MRVLGIEITDDYHSARLDKRARKTIQRHGPWPIMNMNIKPCSFHTDTMDILCQFPNDFLSWRYRYRPSSSPWVWYIIHVNGSLWKHCFINLQLHPQACEKFSRTFKGLFRKTFILVYQRMANQKAEEKWNWQGSWSATTATTVVRCKIVVNHQLRSQWLPFFRPKSKTPLKRSQFSLYRQNLKPAPDGFLVAQHIAKRCWRFLSKRGKAWQCVGQAAAINNWGISWAAALDF